MTQTKPTARLQETPSIQATMVAIQFFSFIAIALCAFIFFMHSNRPVQTYFTYNQFGQRTQVFPKDEPNVTPKALLNWATLATTSAHTIDFFNYQNNIDGLKDFFTRSGYNKFVQSSRGLINKIISEKLIVSATAIGAAVIVWEGLELDGAYAWNIQVPLLLTYIGQGDKQEQYVISNLKVTRVPTDLAATGIGINQMVDGEVYAAYL